APACRLARPIARASEDARKHVRLPIDHVGVAIAARSDQSNVFGDGCVCRTGPLAIHDLVEIVRIRDIGVLHFLLDHAYPDLPRRDCVTRLHAPRLDDPSLCSSWLDFNLPSLKEILKEHPRE